MHKGMYEEQNDKQLYSVTELVKLHMSWYNQILVSVINKNLLTKQLETKESIQDGSHNNATRSTLERLTCDKRDIQWSVHQHIFPH